MKNKFLSFIFALCLIIPCALVFSACGKSAPKVLYVGNADALEDAIDDIAKGGTIVLNNDIVIDETLEVDKKVTIDLNGKTISNKVAIFDDTDDDDWSLISICERGDLIIKGNGTLKAKYNDCYAIDVQDGARVVIEDGTFIGNISAVYVHQGEAIINDGTFSIQKVDANGYALLVNCYDVNYNAEKANIIINGGTFANYDPIAYPAQGQFVAEDNVIVSVKASSTVTNYVVAPFEQAKLMNGSIRDLEGNGLAYSENSLKNAKESVIKLVSNIELRSQLYITRNVTIDLNGYTIYNTVDIWDDEDTAVENPVDEWSLISVRTNGNLTIKNGTLQAKVNDCYAIDVRYGARVTIESGKYVGNVSAIYVVEGQVVINDGEFDIQQLGSNNSSAYTLNCKDDNFYADTANIIVNGGKYANYNPTEFLASGYQAEAQPEDGNNDVWYIVSAIAE